MKYNNNIVYVSYAIAFLGSYITICLCDQLRLSYLRTTESSIYEKSKWFLLMGIALGGVGIWCMHFIGMSAMRMEDSAGDPVDFYYNIPITITSLIVSVLTTAMGMTIMSYDRLFAKTKKEILEMFVDDLKHLSLTDAKKAQDGTILMLILTKDVRFLIAGGVLTGGGVCIMHYCGMAAMQFHGNLVWNWGIVVASIFVAVFAATAAFWILFRLLSIFPGKESLRLMSAVIMGIAVCGMHYTGMEAANIIYDPHSASAHPDKFQNSSLYWEYDQLAMPTILSAVIVLLLLSMIIMEDMRRHIQSFHLKTNYNSGEMSSPARHRPRGDSSNNNLNDLRRPETTQMVSHAVPVHHGQSRFSLLRNLFPVKTGSVLPTPSVTAADSSIDGLNAGNDANINYLTEP
jgi:NO-binding membrane sensor protein with MHYT domain